MARFNSSGANVSLNSLIIAVGTEKRYIMLIREKLKTRMSSHTSSIMSGTDKQTIAQLY